MSQIKLKHSGGNGVIIAAPSSNPASDRTLTLPSDGNGVIAKTDNSGNLAVSGNLTVSGNINGGLLDSRRININGGLNVAQRGTSFTGTSGPAFLADRYKVGFNTISAGTCTTSQQSLTSSDTPYAQGLRKYGRFALGQAGTAAGGSFIEVLHKFEGQDINASGWDHTSSSSNITVSFWFRCSTNQTFYANLRSRDGTSKVYTFSFTATGNNTWTKITKTIPGNSNVQIDNDNGNGLDFRIWIFLGTDGTDNTGSVTLDQWRTYASDTRVPDMATTWLTAGASTFDVTGFQFEVGNTATDFDNKSYGEEMLLCKRYYQKIDQTLYGCAYSTGSGFVHHYHCPEMRATPSFTYTGRATSSGFNHASYSNHKIFQCIMSHLSSYLQGAVWDAEL